MKSSVDAKGRDLSDLPQNVLDKGANLAYKNALRHLKAAHLLADSRDYGNGISHLVLAAEEATKAAILFGYRFHDQIPISNPRKMFTELFRKHESKQVPFMAIVIFVNFVRKTIQYLENYRGHFARNMSRLSSQFQSERSLMGRIEKELKSMNKSKNDGFYLGYLCGSWISPNKKTKRDFMRLEESVSPYLEAMKAIFTMTPKEIEDQRQNLEKLFSNNRKLKGVLSQAD